MTLDHGTSSASSDQTRGMAGPVMRKPVSGALRVLLVTAGTASLGLGIAGIYLPILPTTPFLLLAAACYMRSSDRMYGWLMNHPKIGPAARMYLHTRTIPARLKYGSLVFAWVIIIAAVIWVDRPLLKAVLLVLGATKTIFMLRMRSYRSHD